MKFNFEKVTKSANDLYKETTAKVETLTTSHEGWYEKAKEKVELFAKDIDPNLSVWIDRDPVLRLHFLTPFNPYIKWDMEITETAEYLNGQLKADIVKKYAELSESPELKEKFRLWRIESARVNAEQSNQKSSKEDPNEEDSDSEEAMQGMMGREIISDALGSSDNGTFSGGGGDFGGGGASGSF